MAAERQQQRTLGPYYVISANAPGMMRRCQNFFCESQTPHGSSPAGEALDFDRESPCFLGRLAGHAGELQKFQATRLGASSNGISS